MFAELKQRPYLCKADAIKHLCNQFFNIMKFNEITGTYGSTKTRCTVFVCTNSNGSCWYVRKGGTIVNLTFDKVQNGVDTELLNDHDCFTLGAACYDSDTFQEEMKEYFDESENKEPQALYIDENGPEFDLIFDLESKPVFYPMSKAQRKYLENLGDQTGSTLPSTSQLQRYCSKQTASEAIEAMKEGRKIQIH